MTGSSRGWLGRIALLGLVALMALGGCSRPTPAPVLVPGTERYPDYPRPEITPDLARAGRAVASHDRGWVQLQMGDPKAAERTFRDLLKRTPAFYPSQAALGFTRLAQRDNAGALEWFDRALSNRGDYASALVGRADVLLEMGREGEAFDAYSRILEVLPDHPVARRRVQVLRLRAVQSDVSLGRQALESGDLRAARAALERAVRASPESGFLHRDLARIARRLGEDDEAMIRVDRAIELDADDADALALRGQLHETRGELDAALTDLRRARRLDPAIPDLGATITSIEARLAEAALPAEFKELAERPRMTRGDLAALLSYHLPGLLEARRPAVLITDARRHWAQDAILQVIRSGVMNEYANHTFQPGSPVTRGDVAVTVNRVLTMLATKVPAAASSWQNARLSFSDVRPGNALYVPISRAVASGVLAPVDGERFAARQTLTGEEGTAAILRLAQVVERAGLSPGGGVGSRP